MAKREVYLKYGQDKYGNFIHVDNVPNGINCECVCPHCKGIVCAKNAGTEREHHFAHHNPIPGLDTGKCFERTQHDLAINIVRNAKCIMLPPLDCITAKKEHFVRVEVEERNDSKDLQPDLVGETKDGLRIAIEIKYTHAVDDIKLRKIIDNELICVEIDISSLPQDEKVIREFLCESKENREWLNNPKYERIIVEHYQQTFSNVELLSEESYSNKRLYKKQQLNSFEPYQRTKYHIIGVEKTQLGPAKPKPSNTPKNNRTSSLLDVELYKEKQNTPSNIDVYRRMPTTRLPLKKSGPETISDIKLKEYYYSLHCHNYFYEDKRLNSKIAYYKACENRVAVIHNYQNQFGYYRSRLTGVTVKNGVLQFEEIADYSSEIPVEKELLRWLELA